MHLVVGLGNPGPKYAGNRHNVGFMVVDELARRAGVTLSPARRLQSEAARATLAGTAVLLLRPLTYMNLAGEAVGAAARYYDLPPERIVVIHDDLDLPFGTLRLKRGGGSGGHNGLKSIIAHLGSRDFLRVRLGIGRPPPGREVVPYVLSDFGADERPVLPEIVGRAADAVEAMLSDGLEAAMNRYHRRST
ncbi:MAG: aminoacyl-tRNA hydrolase [Deltaproteobacteria bacterium]|nr:MAG: aminoacyl-tRNA hydrolase [Deltaproteobacteria bacterium]